MVFGAIVIALAVVVGIAVAVAEARKHSAERREGITRFGTLTLQGRKLQVRGVTRDVTTATRAEVVGSVQEGRRSTATRTLAGGVAAGPVGALVGHAAKKKTRSSSAVLTIDGDDWADSIPVGPTSYAEAVRFAQAINLAARSSKR
jgi:hypothetical protein